MKDLETDVGIIGCGPAGLQAAIHAARSKVKVVVIGHPERSALMKSRVENYLGIESAEGEEILKMGVNQAKKFGAQILEEDVIKLSKDEKRFLIETDHERKIKAKALILAPGISRVKLGIKGEKEFLGRGVSYCASCDCNFFRGKRVAVIGDESIAASSALLLKDYASKVFWVSKEMKVAKPLLDKIKSTTIEIISPAVPLRIYGDEVVTGLELDDGRKIDLDGVFIELGAMGSIELALEIGIIPDPSGLISVDNTCKTEVDGVYACGDVTGQPWQLAKAVGQGCIAGLKAAEFVKNQEG